MTAQPKKIVVLTGAGMSAESGFATFRDSGGLWETHPVEQVATPEGWQRDPDFVNEFYNGLRRQLVEARPNRGHELLAELEQDYAVRIVTQNVDDLHERAAEWVAEADVLVIIGTSLVVYPAAGLVRYARRETPIFLIDPQEVDVPDGRKVHLIRAKASDGVAELREALRKC